MVYAQNKQNCMFTQNNKLIFLETSPLITKSINHSNMDCGFFLSCYPIIWNYYWGIKRNPDANTQTNLEDIILEKSQHTEHHYYFISMKCPEEANSEVESTWMIVSRDTGNQGNANAPRFLWWWRWWNALKLKNYNGCLTS